MDNYGIIYYKESFFSHAINLRLTYALSEEESNSTLRFKKNLNYCEAPIHMNAYLLAFC